MSRKKPGYGKEVICSAPGRVDPAGGASDWSQGATFAVAVHDSTVVGKMRAWARVRENDLAINLVVMDGNTFVANEKEPLTEDSPIFSYEKVLRFFRLHGLSVEIATAIPPRSGLGGSTATLVALIAAMDKLLGNKRTLQEVAELAQIADLRKGQVRGWQDPYASAFGFANLFGFIGKTQGAEMDHLREPFASIQGLEPEWRALGADIIIAIPKDLFRISGTVNANLAQRLTGDDGNSFKRQLELKAKLACLAATCLICGNSSGFFGAIRQDNEIAKSWGWVTESHQKIIDCAMGLNAYASKVCGAAGAVAIFCPKSTSEVIFATLQRQGSEVHHVCMCEGVRYESAWLF